MSMETRDYSTTMQAAALAYLRRHKEQYLSDADLLYESCVRHLSTALEVPLFLAQKVSQLAWNELLSRQEPLWLGIDWVVEPDATVAYLIDYRNNLRFPIPLRLLPQRLLDQRPVTLTHHP
ncbi:hypothetical protein [Pseudomonas sp. TCU-HL1]|uniref:hypothetical protein n=1 Tax=Pseudomonas sp. TCU-HL1 TaxID=1856685 RepID=UPI00083DBCDD|nr:hypothetical protein [Pseudomonas sp. TCU-HL1]AOE85858.1 hypothetical protein THL1_3310 [Pseudomonas sp. TCU-HL1]